MIVLGQNKLGLFDVGEFHELYIYDNSDDNNELKEFAIGGSYYNHYLGRYKTEEEAKYVLRQIYEHLRLHSDSYEMPSQEEAKDMLDCIIASRGD